MSTIKATIMSVFVLVACLLLAAQANPTQNSGLSAQQKQPDVNNDELPIGDDGSMFLAATGCASDLEELRQGILPSCEPTCSNPKPVCPRIFVALDYVPCFCKAPLVRNEKTKECVNLNQCPRTD